VRKLFYACFCLIVLFGCSSTVSVVSNNTNTRTVSLNASEADLGDPSKWFTEDAQENILELSLPDEIGKRILDQVITGYKNQTSNLKLVENTEPSDIIFEVKEITVKRGRFTFNFLKPGPVYVMKMKADIIINGEIVSTEAKKTIVNMASVVFPEDPVKFMKPSEKRITEYQVETFRKGLRKLYQSLYFDAFDISLRL
jgi:archaellum component FlaF (FlaF/FlaG flagellin family)